MSLRTFERAVKFDISTAHLHKDVYTDVQLHTLYKLSCTLSHLVEQRTGLLLWRLCHQLTSHPEAVRYMDILHGLKTKGRLTKDFKPQPLVCSLYPLEGHAKYKLLQNQRGGGCETGWDLDPFAAVLTPGQTPPPAAESKETLRD